MRRSARTQVGSCRIPGGMDRRAPYRGLIIRSFRPTSDPSYPDRQFRHSKRTSVQQTGRKENVWPNTTTVALRKRFEPWAEMHTANDVDALRCPRWLQSPDHRDEECRVGEGISLNTHFSYNQTDRQDLRTFLQPDEQQARKQQSDRARKSGVPAVEFHTVSRICKDSSSRVLISQVSPGRTVETLGNT